MVDPSVSDHPTPPSKLNYACKEYDKSITLVPHIIMNIELLHEKEIHGMSNEGTTDEDPNPNRFISVAFGSRN